MTPYEFLVEELENVRRLLSDTLRHDYGPDHSGEYYNECNLRLDNIKLLIDQANKQDVQEISSIYVELSSVARRITLIERAHLGEFSWPFANEIRNIAGKLLYDRTLKDKSPPIVHVIAESYGYRILNEGSFKHSPGRQRIAVVEFPRTLKHQVLFHTLLGHEICHTGFLVPAFIGRFSANFINPAFANTPLETQATATSWINSQGAPNEIKQAIARYNNRFGPYSFARQHLSNWKMELVCDMFGLILFGPSFLAAHNTLLTALSPNPYDVDLIDQSHPPYEIRNCALIQCMKVLGWDTPSINKTGNKYHLAEKKLLDRLCGSTYSPWTKIFDDKDLAAALSSLQNLLVSDGVLGYQKVGGSPLQSLLAKISRGMPPILDTISVDGTPDLISLDVASILYAGWIFAEHGSDIDGTRNLSFFDINRLCEQALLQREAIVICS